MFEPTTLSLPELAQRWARTPRQILEFASDLGLPLYFNFGCLAFDETDSWHRSSGDQWEAQEREWLTKYIASKEEQIIRARAGQLSQWEQLPPGGTAEVRKEIDAMKKKLRFIDELLAQRETERAQCELGILRAGPGTLLDIANNGEVKFPRWAFHTAGPITTSVTRDKRGNPYLEWAGRKMILEARNDGDPRWRRMLSAQDLFASMVEVKAIEAKGTTELNERPASSTAPAESVVSETDAENLQSWSPVKPQKWQGYNKPLFEFLERTHVAGGSLPKATDVLDAFRKNRPHEVMTVLVSGLEYYGPNGECKSADLKAITKAIGRIVVREAAN